MMPEARETTIVTQYMKPSSGNVEPRWSLLTNHGRVLASIAANPEARLRDVAHAARITERTAAHIVNDLEEAGYLTKTRVGRRKRYEIDGERQVGTPRLATMTVAQLLGLLLQALEQPLA
jgi:DNA-binding IclR family transcriptional regulator